MTLDTTHARKPGPKRKRNLCDFITIDAKKQKPAFDVPSLLKNAFPWRKEFSTQHFASSNLGNITLDDPLLQSEMGDAPNAQHMTVRDWMAASEKSKAPRYVFSFCAGLCVQQLYKELPVPVDLMKSFMWNAVFAASQYPTEPTKLGLSLHSHEASWIAQLAGTKTWVVAPPGPEDQLPGRPFQPVEAYSGSDGFQRCTQREGEIVFLPAGTWHATENRGRSFAFGFQGAPVYDNFPVRKHKLITQAVIGDVAALEGADVRRHKGVLAEAAFSNGHVEVVKFLLDKAGLSQDQLRQGLGLSAQGADVRLFRWLMPMTISNKTKTFPKWARTIAQAAVKRGREEILRLLLDARASVHMPDEEGQRPLHIAAEGGHARLVQLLLQKRAKKDAKNSDGLTPLQFADGPGTAKALVRSMLESQPVQQLGEL